MKRIIVNVASAGIVGLASAAGHVAPPSVIADEFPGEAHARVAAASAASAAAVDVRALLAAARGANPILCALAARSVHNGWGDWSEGPVTPLRSDTLQFDRGVDDGDFRARRLTAADAQLLLERLASDDACERELAIRLVGRQRDSMVVDGLVSRLRANEPALREVAALGLGYAHAKRAVTPLLAALRDGEPTVRANAAWALGRIDDGRANAPLLALFGDADERVRFAAVVAVGHIDSSSSAAALARVLRGDQSARVRRVAAWGLGQLRGASESVGALTEALQRDADAGVREMSAWALGTIERDVDVGVLATVLARDTDDRVRETLAWALGNIGDRASVDALGRVAEGDKSSRVRGTAAWALGTMRGRDRRAPAGLVRLLRDDEEQTRLKAAWALGNIGDSSAIGAIRDALKAEQEQQVRRALIRALLHSGGRSEGAMEELLKSEDPTVREAAVRGLVGRNAFDPWPWPWPRPRPFP